MSKLTGEFNTKMQDFIDVSSDENERKLALQKSRSDLKFYKYRIAQETANNKVLEDQATKNKEFNEQTDTLIEILSNQTEECETNAAASKKRLDNALRKITQFEYNSAATATATATAADQLAADQRAADQRAADQQAANQQAANQRAANQLANLQSQRAANARQAADDDQRAANARHAAKLAADKKTEDLRKQIAQWEEAKAAKAAKETEEAAAEAAKAKAAEASAKILTICMTKELKAVMRLFYAIHSNTFTVGVKYNVYKLKDHLYINISKNWYCIPFKISHVTDNFQYRKYKDTIFCNISKSFNYKALLATDTILIAKWINNIPIFEKPSSDILVDFKSISVSRPFIYDIDYLLKNYPQGSQEGTLHAITHRGGNTKKRHKINTKNQTKKMLKY